WSMAVLKYIAKMIGAGPLSSWKRMFSDLLNQNRHTVFSYLLMYKYLLHFHQLFHKCLVDNPDLLRTVSPNQKQLTGASLPLLLTHSESVGSSAPVSLHQRTVVLDPHPFV